MVSAEDVVRDGRPRSDRVFWLDGGGARDWSGSRSLVGVLGDDDVSLSYYAATRRVVRHVGDREEVVGDDVFTVLEAELARDVGDPSVHWVGFLGYAARPDLPALIKLILSKITMGAAREDVEVEPWTAAQERAEREAALKRAEAEGAGIGTRQARVRTELQEKDIEGKRRVYEQRIQSAQTRLDLLSVRAQHLSEQVSAASRQMQDLAVKAIEGQANASSLSAFKELAMEQAKAQGKGKN